VWLAVKGKPWGVDEERLLRRLVEEGKSVGEIAGALCKSEEAIRQKMFNLGLKCECVKEKQSRVPEKSGCFCSSRLDPPSELPNVEESLKILASCMLRIVEPGLGKEEVRRLQVAADLATRYKDAYAECMHYREVEQRLNVLERKYEEDKTKHNEKCSQNLPVEPGQSPG